MLQINSLYRINVRGDHQTSDTKQLDNIQLNKVHGYSTKGSDKIEEPTPQHNVSTNMNQPQCILHG